MRRPLACAFALMMVAACGREPSPEVATPPAAAPNLLLVTIDTLRADRVGAYGDRTARTPAMDALAARGATFTRAYATAPITLTSHASLMTGLYPAGHGGRHNGIRIRDGVPTLAEALSRAGLATGAFVGAFPLDRRFGLDRGFATYGDTMPRGADGRPANERGGQAVVDDAIDWLDQHRVGRFFLWVHLFEPHAPYGDARTGRPVLERYGDEIAEADRQVGRLVEALGDARARTIVAVTSDHGEAFGEHGEIAHSIFVYDTTLRVPLLLAGPGVERRTIEAPVSLVDIAPTVAALLGMPALDADGIDLASTLRGGSTPTRDLYAESYAPLLDFGWSPLRSIRTDGWKYIDAPKPEVYDVEADPDESQNLVDRERERAGRMRAAVDRFGPAEFTRQAPPDKEAAARLQALGYVSGPTSATTRPDPKDRRELAARLAQVTSGELHGETLAQTLRGILQEDPRNPLAHLRLGYAILDVGDCRQASVHFEAAITARYPSADPHLGLAGCQAAAGDLAEAMATLRAADGVEPGNPIVLANLGLVLAEAGKPREAIASFERAIQIDPDLHQARFALAVALADAGRRKEAALHAEELLRRLPPAAPQRAEIQRLLGALGSSR
jgi:choline-sulfatase